MIRQCISTSSVIGVDVMNRELWTLWLRRHEKCVVRQNKYSYEREKSALFIEQWQTLNLKQSSFICILGRGTIVLDGTNVHLLAVVRSPAVMVLHHVSEK